MWQRRIASDRSSSDVFQIAGDATFGRQCPLLGGVPTHNTVPVGLHLYLVELTPVCGGDLKKRRGAAVSSHCELPFVKSRTHFPPGHRDTGTKGHRTTKQDTGHKTQDTKHRTQNTGHKTQDTKHRTQDTGHGTHGRTQDRGHRIWDTGPLKWATNDPGHGAPRTEDMGHNGLKCKGPWAHNGPWTTQTMNEQLGLRITGAHRLWTGMDCKQRDC